MNLGLAREIVGLLSMAGVPPGSVARLERFGLREWEQTLDWLDASGLALYFWNRLKAIGGDHALPPQIAARLTRNLADHRQRVAKVAEEFNDLNRGFEAAGVRYAVIKGFALIPDYCPDGSLRTVSDHDYLLPEEFLEPAVRVLQAAGYVRKNQKETLAVGFYLAASPHHLAASAEELYSADLPREVELHLKVWNTEEGKIHISPPDGLWARTRSRSCQGLRFNALGDEDALIEQVLHAFRHILYYWCRLSNLLEMAYFLQRRSTDLSFWERVRELTRGRPKLSQAMGVVFSLASGRFGAQVPAAVRAWTVQNMTPAMILWIERYGGDLALRNFSGTKYSLFLHREFVSNPRDWREVQRRQLFPLHQPSSVAETTSPRLSLRLKVARHQSAFILRRLEFHVKTVLGYVWEYPSWERARRRAGASQPS